MQVLTACSSWLKPSELLPLSCKWKRNLKVTNTGYNSTLLFHANNSTMNKTNILVLLDTLMHHKSFMLCTQKGSEEARGRATFVEQFLLGSFYVKWWAYWGLMVHLWPICCWKAGKCSPFKVVSTPILCASKVEGLLHEILIFNTKTSNHIDQLHEIHQTHAP